MSQQTRTRRAALDRPCRSKCFHGTFAACTDELRPHVPDHLVGGRNALQLFRNVFAEMLTCANCATLAHGWNVNYTIRRFSAKGAPARTTLQRCSPE
jgi:hypothetical protein